MTPPAKPSRRPIPQRSQRDRAARARHQSSQLHRGSQGTQGRRRSRVSVRGLLTGLPHRLESEVFSGLLMMAAAVVALVWASSPWHASYETLSSTVVGPHALHLDLDLATWAADGLLAVFFFVVGLELKQELVVGSLRDLREATLPMLAAVFGMAGPALVYVAVQLASGGGNLAGWAVPTATDIAFAVAVLSIFGRGTPPAARTFLLTLAVVDDLLAIIVIAVFYSHGLSVLALLGALAVVALFGVLVARGMTRWYVLVPLAAAAWWLMHASGVHATIAGVLLGLTVPARPTRSEPTGMTARFTHLVHPWSAGLALPVFALFAAGVSLSDAGGLGEVLTNPVSVGVYLGLPVGKVLGIWGSVALLTRFTRLRLGHGVDLPDVLALAAIAGIGFTVSLLVAGLAFGTGATADIARAAVLLGTVASAALGAVLLRLRMRTRRRGRPSTRTRVVRG